METEKPKEPEQWFGDGKLIRALQEENEQLKRRLDVLEQSNAQSLERIGTNLFESEWILRTYATLLVLSVPQWPALSGIDLLQAFELGRRAQQLAVASLAGYQTALAEFQKSQEAV